MSVRRLFLASADLTRPLLASAETAAAWAEPSALREMDVGALTGHLVRAVTSVEAYLEMDPPAEEEVLDAPGYFLSIEGLSDGIEGDLHRAIRRRAAEEAAGGVGDLVARWDRTTKALTARFGSEPPDRVVAALGGRRLMLDQCLVTRLVEMLVHADDLAVSVGLPTPEYPPEGWRAVQACLVEMARRRHGDLAVVRALARRERDDAEALRVL